MAQYYLWDVISAGIDKYGGSVWAPTPVGSPSVGEKLTFSVNIADGENIDGYLASVQSGYDHNARLWDVQRADYLKSSSVLYSTGI